MIWKSVLEKRIKAKRQILFSKDDEALQDLRMLIEKMPRKAVILWTLELAEETVRVLERRYPEDKRAGNALALTRLWAAGDVKMPVAKRAILDCHTAAKEIQNPSDIALFHAVGQACGTVHAKGHAIGYPIYDLTALIRENGLDESEQLIDMKIHFYIEKLLYWGEHYKDVPCSWAKFIHD